MQVLAISGCGSVAGIDANATPKGAAAVVSDPFVEIRVIVDKKGDVVGLRSVQLRDKQGARAQMPDEASGKLLLKEPAIAQALRRELAGNQSVSIRFFEGKPTRRPVNSPSGVVASTARASLMPEEGENPQWDPQTDPFPGENGNINAAAAYAAQITSVGDSLVAEIDAILAADSVNFFGGALLGSMAEGDQTGVAMMSSSYSDCPSERQALQDARFHTVTTTVGAVAAVIAAALVPAATAAVITWVATGGLGALFDQGYDIVVARSRLDVCRQGH